MEVGRTCKRCPLTFEIRGNCFVIRDADQYFQTDLLDHELPLGEKLFRKTVEQTRFDLFA